MIRQNDTLAIVLAAILLLILGGIGPRHASGLVAQGTGPTQVALSENANVWATRKLQLPDLEGRPRQLSEWKGKVLIVNFWAGWCGPCQFEIPHFVRWQKNYGTKGLQIVSVGVDKVRSLKNVARSLDINYPILVLEHEQSGALLNKWGNPRGSIPHTVVIDRNGIVKLIQNGTLGEDDFEIFIRPLLEGKN